MHLQPPLVDVCVPIVAAHNLFNIPFYESNNSYLTTQPNDCVCTCTCVYATCTCLSVKHSSIFYYVPPCNGAIFYYVPPCNGLCKTEVHAVFVLCSPAKEPVTLTYMYICSRLPAILRECCVYYYLCIICCTMRPSQWSQVAVIDEEITKHTLYVCSSVHCRHVHL